MTAASAAVLAARDPVATTDEGLELADLARTAGARAAALELSVAELPRLVRPFAKRAARSLRRDEEAARRDAYALLDAAVDEYVRLGLIERGQRRPDVVEALFDVARLAAWRSS